MQVVSTDIIAAQIQAVATEHAAVVQGEYTLASGVFLVVAAFIAYYSSLRQIKLSEANAKARVWTFKYRLTLEVQHLLDFSCRIAHQINIITISGNYDLRIEFPQLKYELLNDKYWEDHAPLGKTVVEQISRLRQAVDSLNELEEETRENRPKADQVLKTSQGTMLALTKMKQPIGFQPLTGGEVILNFGQQINDVASSLLVELGTKGPSIIGNLKWDELRLKVVEYTRTAQSRKSSRTHSP